MNCNLKPIQVSVREDAFSDFKTIWNGGTVPPLHFQKQGIHHRLLSAMAHRDLITVDKTPSAILDAALFIVKLRSRADYDRIVDGADETTDLVDCNEFYRDTLRSIDPVGDIARWEDARIIRAVYSLADGMLHASDVNLTKNWSGFLNADHWDLQIPPASARFSFDYSKVTADDLQFSLLYDILSASIWRTITMPPDSDKKLSFHELTKNVKSKEFKYSAVALNLAVLSNEWDLGITPFNFHDTETILEWCNNIEDLRIHPTDYEKVMEKIGVYFYYDDEGAEDGNS